MLFRSLAEQGKNLWGGRIHYRLDRVSQSDAEPKAQSPGRSRLEELRPVLISKKLPPMEGWSQGEALKGTGLLHPFRLPSVGLGILDWRGGRQDLLLTATPETSLREVWKGYGYQGTHRNRSLNTLLVQLGILIVLALGACAQVVALGSTRAEEAPIEVIDDVGSAPVEVGADGGHVGGKESGQH